MISQFPARQVDEVTNSGMHMHTHLGKLWRGKGSQSCGDQPSGVLGSQQSGSFLLELHGRREVKRSDTMIDSRVLLLY